MKSMVIISFLLLLSSWFVALGQSPVVWETRFPGQDTGVIVTHLAHTSDGGIIVAGTEGFYGAGFLRLDAAGHIVWHLVMGGSLSTDKYAVYPGLIYEDSGSIAVIAGSKSFLPQGDLRYFYRAGVGMNGTVQWETYDSTQANITDKWTFLTRAITRTRDNGFIISTGYEEQLCLLMRMDSSGLKPVFRQRWNAPEIMQSWILSVVQTPDGGSLSFGMKSFFNARDSISLMRNDSTGKLLWEKILPFGGDTSAAAAEMILLPDGGTVCVAPLIVPSLKRNVTAMIRTDPDGNVLWQRIYDYADPAKGVVGQTVCRLRDGGYFIGGYRTILNGTVSTVQDDDFYLLKTDSSGTPQWEYVYNSLNGDRIERAIELSDGRIAIAGESDYRHENTIREWYYQMYAAIIQLPSAGTSIDVPAEDSPGILPNPARDRIVVRYNLRQPGPVLLHVYDVLGRHKLRRDEGVQGAGRHTAGIDLTGFSSGRYVLRIASGGRTTRTPFVILP